MFKLLIVDDNPVFRRALSDLLTRHFPMAHLEQAQDGEGALARAEILRPDMVIMDVDLPGENGLEVTRKMKELWDYIVIVILSGYDFPEYRQQAYRNGADCFISKGGIYCMSDVLSRIEGTIAWKKWTAGEGAPF